MMVEKVSLNKQDTQEAESRVENLPLLVVSVACTGQSQQCVNTEVFELLPWGCEYQGLKASYPSPLPTQWGSQQHNACPKKV